MNAIDENPNDNPVPCPGCGTKLRIDEQSRRRSIKCKVCKSVFKRPRNATTDVTSARHFEQAGHRHRGHRSHSSWRTLAKTVKTAGLVAVGAGAGWALTAVLDHVAPGHWARYILAPLFMAVGTFLMAVVWLDWHWFFRGWREQLAQRAVARGSTRATYVLAGGVLAVGGIFIACLPLFPVVTGFFARMIGLQ